jgi:hypothetical protein
MKMIIDLKLYEITAGVDKFEIAEETKAKV